MRSRILAALLALPLAAWLPADPARTWSFPRDHWAHPGHRTEWWYLTGTLESLDEPGRRFGYQLTFFSVGLVPDPPRVDSAWASGGAVMVHLAVTDVATGAHAFSEVLWRRTPLLAGLGAAPDPVLAWARPPAGQEGRWSLALDGDATFRLDARDAARGLGLALTAAAARPPTLQGPNGYSRKSDVEGYASSYYSLTRLATEGTLELSGKRHRVRGTSWMDKEFGSSQLAPSQVGWDWWSLRLADGRDLMLYALRRADGAADFKKATLVERDGTVRWLGAAEWTATALGRWRSPETGADYPSGWDVAVPGAGVRVRVVPEVKASENVSRLVPGLAYWEGPVRILDPDGAAAGEGYVELTGYGDRARPPI
ncbi:MAG: lipocalin-like domain-containing protein [Anaeromyxobacteraceae bacterium]